MKGFFKRFETVMVAAAFAEAGEFETAKQIIRRDEKRPRKPNRPYRSVRPPERKVLRAD